VFPWPPKGRGGPPRLASASAFLLVNMAFVGSESLHRLGSYNFNRLHRLARPGVGAAAEGVHAIVERIPFLLEDVIFLLRVVDSRRNGRHRLGAGVTADIGISLGTSLT
jgi:hypothetical protein